ncbi:MAG: response regulator, partial [Candidatus Hodarchaeota archaeon]
MEEVIRILHVDDEPQFLKLAKTYLEKISAEISLDSTNSPYNALRQLDNQEYDVIISDYVMPELNGLELLNEIRKRGNPIPFIILTGRGREEVVIEALNLGVDYYLQKGADPKSLFAELFGIIQKEAGKKREIKRRKRAEETLKRSEKRFTMQFKTFPVPAYMWQKSNDDFVLINYNDAAEKLTRGLVKDFLKIYASDFYQERSQILTDLHTCYKNQITIRRELWYEFSTGEKRFLQVLYSFLPPDLVIVYTEDITKRKRAEKTLQESKDQYHLLLNSIQDGCWAFDTTWHYTLVNEAGARLVNKSPKELIGRKLTDLFPGIEKTAFFATYDQVMKNRTVESISSPF